MAADLHIHVFEGITEDDIADFFSSHLGSKYFNMERNRQATMRDNEIRKRYSDSENRIDMTRWKEYNDQTLYGKFSNTPNIWVGEVSWLKAALFDDEETFVPDPIGIIHEVIGDDLPVLDEDLKKKIMRAFGVNNSTGYSMTNADKVEEFLNEHMGKKLFTVSW